MNPVTVAGAAAYLLDGKNEDLRHLPPQNRQQHDFTFVRLIYNGRIPGYIKNWYTDYPTGDRNLIEILKRMTSIDVSSESRAIPTSGCARAKLGLRFERALCGLDRLLERARENAHGPAVTGLA